ncbi:MAG: glycogen debranching enzyme family protein, partial [Mailhella sp.]|nr:glycogen debranching enzyme family protein [Mailhella sp.]
MKYSFSLNPRASDLSDGLNQEWLLTNAGGDFSSGTVRGCATRRYHGLLASQTSSGRFMLLSALEDSLVVKECEIPLSCRIHPGIVWPDGWKLEGKIVCNQQEVSRLFSIPLPSGEHIYLRRAIRLCQNECRAIMRYEIQDTPEARSCGDVKLVVKPLISCRPADYLRHADQAHARFLRRLEHGLHHTGFFYRPDDSIPPLIMEMPSQGFHLSCFDAAPDWYYHILYPSEKYRGYDWDEDLFMPGTFYISLHAGTPAWISAGTTPLTETPEALWENSAEGKDFFAAPLLEHLRREGSRFIVNISGESLINAGYHWFGPWGRDTLIALPGLTFLAGNVQAGKAVLRQIGQAVQRGLVPNLLGSGNGTASYNSADASLWYMLAVHRLANACPQETTFIREECWPTVKDMLFHFARGTMPDGNGNMLVKTDADGLLHVGNRNTQLTWMDASVDGMPVTPRHGCVVELNALWFNALAFARKQALLYGEIPPVETELLKRLEKAFRRVFIPSGNDRACMDGGLYDTWSSDEGCSRLIRPNQVIAAAMPFSPLTDEERLSVTDCVKKHLLTPFGLRTLSPAHAEYQPVCQGSQSERDRAYHQGTVWPWLLGFYAEALLYTCVEQDAKDFLRLVTPLFTNHLQQAGLGCISEIFDGDPPHSPGGCIAQAWSTAESL